MPLTFSFDIGYASIGWCVLSGNSRSQEDPKFLGTGVVTFPNDDCLASKRRDLRRTRRHIRSTRQRIERLKCWFLHQGILSRDELDLPGHAAPFLLAAASLQNLRTLTAWELWTVLRWYAHNRGYDGNSRWARDEGGDDKEGDTLKEEAARALLTKYGTSTMAETVCKCLDLNVEHHSKRISSFLPYKTLDAAYPRHIVEGEVREIVNKHIAKISGFDSAAARLIMKDNPLSDQEREILLGAGIKLPKSYHGGLLFGQLIPRFDNRIISRCPITWAGIFDREIAAGKSEVESKHQAEKLAKVPAAKSSEFLHYRFARILANLKADGKVLEPELRASLWRLAEKNGRLTHKDIEREIKAYSGSVATNIDAFFKIHPDSEQALILDPVMDEVRKAQGTRAKLSSIWNLLSDEVKSDIIFMWRNGKSISFAQILQKSGNDPQLTEILEKERATLKPKKGKPVPTFDSYLLNTRVAADFPSGRAAYARPILKQVVAEVLAGFDPNRPARSAKHPEGEDKPEDGVLYPLLDPTSRVRELQDARPLDKLTNNHLVRHRLLILDRLLDDMISEFCATGQKVERVVVEVARELKEFSGKTAKEIASELNNRLKDFKSAVDHLQENAPNLALTGSLIRKCRIAMDMKWQCPFTAGGPYDASDLSKLEREHIIPYATRNSNALHALVLTWPAVNRMKGKRTARQFIIENEGKQVDGMPNLSLMTLKQYDAFVDKLDTKGHLDDYRRKKARKALLATTDFEDKELGFTPGALTQSSHLMKLAMRSLKAKLPDALCDPIPGQVTGEIRKTWNLIGTLARVSPEIIDPASGKPRPKDEIRAITHLHHAVDAATIALAAHYFPLQKHGQDQKGKIWQALLKRNRSQEEIKFLQQLGIFESYLRVRTAKDGTESRTTDVRLRELSASLKNQLARSLAECRVMQHVPADRSGTKAELTTWGLIAVDGDYAILVQRINRSTLEIEETEEHRRWKDKPLSKESAKLLLKYENRLNNRQINLVKRGILKLTSERVPKILGLKDGSLKSRKGALIIGDNFGIMISPKLGLVPFHAVHAILSEVRNVADATEIPILRNGTCINVTKGTWKGMWRIISVKDSEAYGISVDLAKLDGLKLSKGNARVSKMLEDGLEILPRCYTGYKVI